MYKLKKLNIVRIVAEDTEKSTLINEGFELVSDKEEPDLATMTVDELKCYAEGKGVDLGKAAKKDDIVAVIKAAGTPAASPVK